MKSQATIPFFAQQLISILVFLIVLFTFLDLNKDVVLTSKEYDNLMFSDIAFRRLVSTSDCLAYEEREVYVDEDGNVYEGYRVYPGIIDERKLYDFKHLNCLRLDDLDNYRDVDSGYANMYEGTGISHTYYIYINIPNHNKKYTHYSLVAHTDKIAYSCNAGLFEGCSSVFGGDYECVGYGYAWSNFFKGQIKTYPKCLSYMCFSAKKGLFKTFWYHGSKYNYLLEGCNLNLGETPYFSVSDEIVSGGTVFEKEYPVLIRLINGTIVHGSITFRSEVVTGEKYGDQSIQSFVVKVNKK